MDNTIIVSTICSAVVAVSGVAFPNILELLKRRSEAKSKAIETYIQQQIAAHRDFIGKYNELSARSRIIRMGRKFMPLNGDDYRNVAVTYGDMMTSANNAAVMSTESIRTKILFIVSLLDLSDGELVFKNLEESEKAFNEYISELNEEFNQTVYSRPWFVRLLRKIVKSKKR